MIHSAWSVRPSHSPAGIAYRPQWMNIPNRASRHRRIRASRCSGVACMCFTLRLEVRAPTAACGFANGRAADCEPASGGRAVVRETIRLRLWSVPEHHVELRRQLADFRVLQWDEIGHYELA